MKLKNTTQTVAAVVIIASASSAYSKTELVPGVREQPQSYFYTGKAYDKDLEVYEFACRSYNPGVNRWLSADPTGFPDGVNNQIYAPIPTNQLDADGAFTVTLSNYSFTFDKNGGKQDKLDIGPTYKNSTPDNGKITYEISGELKVSSAALPGGEASISISTSIEVVVRPNYTAHLDGSVSLDKDGHLSYGFTGRTLE